MAREGEFAPRPLVDARAAVTFSASPRAPFAPASSDGRGYGREFWLLQRAADVDISVITVLGAAGGLIPESTHRPSPSGVMNRIV